MAEPNTGDNTNHEEVTPDTNNEVHDETSNHGEATNGEEHNIEGHTPATRIEKVLVYEDIDFDYALAVPCDDVDIFYDVTISNPVENNFIDFEVHTPMVDMVNFDLIVWKPLFFSESGSQPFCIDFNLLPHAGDVCSDIDIDVHLNVEQILYDLDYRFDIKTLKCISDMEISMILHKNKMEYGGIGVSCMVNKESIDNNIDFELFIPDLHHIDMDFTFYGKGNFTSKYIPITFYVYNSSMTYGMEV